MTWFELTEATGEALIEGEVIKKAESFDSAFQVVV